MAWFTRTSLAWAERITETSSSRSFAKSSSMRASGMAASSRSITFLARSRSDMAGDANIRAPLEDP